MTVAGAEAQVASALRLRERGLPYSEVGWVLEVSKGRAYHLVQEAHESCIFKAEEVMRPPGRNWEPTRERARELIGRLGVDMDRARQVAEDHVEQVEQAQINEQFVAAMQEVSVLVEQDRGRKSGLAQSLTRACEMHHAMLVHADRCAAFRRLVDPAFAASVFQRDAAELGAIVSPRTRLDLPSFEPPVRATDDPEGSSLPAPKESKADRQRRDTAIVMARLKGIPVEKVAADHQVTGRTVRNILARWKAEESPMDQRAYAEVAEGVLRLFRQAVHSAAYTGGGSTEELLQSVEQLHRVGDSVALLKDLQLLPSEGLSLSRNPIYRDEIASNLSVRLRMLLEPAVDQTLLDAVLDAVLEEVVPEMAESLTPSLSEAEIVQA
jgi:hypothetical protein